MNDRVAPSMHALPDGEAELSVVVRLPWEDVARLGQEAGRLAAQAGRPVTLDEAVSHRLRTVRTSAAHARPGTGTGSASGSGAGEQSVAAAQPSASVASLPRISGTA
ncbi:hypothetical protein [Streptomyces sp. NPDC003635]